MLKVWQLSTNQVHSTLEGHTMPVTCAAFSPNALFAVSGSEDTQVKIWGLTFGLVVSAFKVILPLGFENCHFEIFFE